MNADANRHILNISDPLASDNERWNAYHWWDDVVIQWKIEQRIHIEEDALLLHGITESFVQKNGCGTVAINYVPTLRECQCAKCWEARYAIR